MDLGLMACTVLETGLNQHNNEGSLATSAMRAHQGLGLDVGPDELS